MSETELSPAVKELMDELISIQEEYNEVQKQLKPLKHQAKELNEQKKQHLGDIMMELNGKVVTYRSHVFGSQRVEKTVYGKKQIEDYLEDDTKVSEYRARFTEERSKPIFQRVKKRKR